jgi:hypothetical protein
MGDFEWRYAIALSSPISVSEPKKQTSQPTGLPPTAIPGLDGQP